MLDDWFERDVKPRVKGPVFLIRFADDAVIGCVLEEDARRIMEVLPKRFGRYGLAVHPEKTKLVRLSQPNKWEAADRENGAFDFLGFTHYWAKSRRGNPNLPLKEQHKQLCQKLRGYYHQYTLSETMCGC